VEPRWALFDLPRAALGGQTGLLVRSLRRGDDVDRGAWSSIEEIGRVSRGRNGVTAEVFRVFRVIGRGEERDAVILPRPG
jgi:hypothetical protein